MADGLVNVQGITSKEVEELAQILNELNELIGDTTNTGGTTSAGTVMAKLNELIGDTTNTGGTTSAGTVMAKLNKLLTDLTTARAGKIDTIHTNTAKLTDTRMGYIDKLANFGATGDAGGTASAGTLMAKLNKMLTDWSTARAGYLDTIHGNVGATNNTGGTTSAGTVMAKLNKLLTDWTTTRAGKIDTIHTNTAKLTDTRMGYIDKLANFGATGDTGGTATAGTVMAKLNQLLNNDAMQYKVSNTVRHTKTDTFTSSDMNKHKKIYQFHAKYDGVISAYATVSNSNAYFQMFIIRSLHDYVNISGMNIGSGTKAQTVSSIYTVAVDSFITNLYFQGVATLNMIFGANWYLNGGFHDSVRGTGLMDTTIPVKKGEEVVFLLERSSGSGYANTSSSVNTTLQIKYDEVKV